MKGLLLKDLYMLKNFKAYLLIIIVFIGLSFFSTESLFLLFYPCLFAGIIPVSLLSYDERNKWHEYCEALPYSKAQLVSVKYIIGLFIQAAALLLTALSLAIQMLSTDSFAASSYFTTIITLLAMICITSSIPLPFIFKWGVEKGRIAYYIMIGAACAGIFIVSDLFVEAQVSQAAFNLPILFILLPAAAIYACSWKLSVVWYQKRSA